MIIIPGFETQQVLYQSKHYTIARVIRISDQQPFVMKALSDKSMTPDAVRRMQHEFEIGQQFNSPNIIRYLELYVSKQHLAILQEAGDMVSLKNAIPKAGFTVTEFLVIAIQMAQALCVIHQKGIFHKDIKPANFIIHPNTLQLKIIDFGSASNIKEESRPLQNIHQIEGTLSYISPEQTGRMNRIIDYRTDFYSLGISFYQLLCGQLPFIKKAAMALIHSHLAQEATPLHSIKPEIPETISAILSTLMMKNAEDRYQSAEGLLWDLQNCQQQMADHNTIIPFHLRQQDISEKLQISQKLYGREKEIEILQSTIQRVSSGKPEILLVAGYSGIGKTTLINEILKPITLKNGYFLTGKFDQLSRSTAYSAIVKAFQGLLKQIKGGSEESIHQWREKLLIALGANGQLIIEVIPELEEIIGKQPPTSSVGSIEAKSRFVNAFQRFITVFAEKDHPLVLFLDDLQWADTASLDLIKLFITNSKTQYFLLIGAYRDNEVNAIHPAILVMEDIKKMEVPIQQITLASPDLVAVQQWIADSLQKPLDEVKALAEIVYQKTQGNPFFVKMFLRALYDEKLLIHSEHQRWGWDLKKIQQHVATANVVEFMISRIQQLEPSIQRVLAIASCLGHCFTMAQLEIAIQTLPMMLQVDLQSIFNAGLAYSIDSTIHFAHDRVQEAAYSLPILSAREKKAIHLLLGRQFQQRAANPDQPDNIFEIVDHYNLGSDLIEKEDEKIKLAHLNLLAAHKARGAVAYTAGLNYIQAGLTCLNENALWSNYCSIAFALYHEKAKLEHSASQFDQAELTMQLLLEHAHSAIEKANIYCLLIDQKTLLTQYKEAIQLGKTALTLLGMVLPEANDALNQLFEQLKAEIEKNLANQNMDALIERPDISDPHKKAILKLLQPLLPTTYINDRALYQVLTAWATNLSLQYGPSPESSLGFVFYGSMLCEQTETTSLGYQFGQLGLKLSEKYNNLTQACKVLFTLSYIVNPWRESLESCLVINNKAFQAGLDSGEIPYAGYSRFYLAIILFLQGQPLPEVWEEANKLLEFLVKMKHQLAIDIVRCVQEIVCDLLGNKRMAEQLSELNQFKQRDNKYALGHQAILQAKKHYLYGNYYEAHQANLEAEKLSPYLSSHYILAIHKFYYALNLAALYPAVSDQEKQNVYSQLINFQQTFKAWAQHCFENFQAKYLLISAEIARIEQHIWDAGKLYDQAIEVAKMHDHPPELALSYELAGQFWLAEQREIIAETYLNKAYLAYQRWGANYKLELLKKQYARLLTVSSTLEPTASTATVFEMTTLNTNSLILDMQNVVRASQMISSHIELDKLLFDMIKIIIETAGAQKGTLLLAHDDNLLVDAEYSVTGEIAVLQAKPMAFWEGPHSIIKYVKKTGEPVVLGCATESEQFNTDLYISHNQIKSLLCIGITRHSELKGILYVENNLTNHVFTQSRVAVLTILANQIAISIENASYFKAQLQASNKIAEEQQARLMEVENYKQKQTEFIAHLCHEVRNPLSGISGYLELLAEKFKTIQFLSNNLSSTKLETIKDVNAQLEEISNILNDMNICADHQKAILDNNLDATMIEANKLKLDDSSFDPKRVIQDVVKIAKAKALQKKLHINVSLPETDVLVKGDNYRFKQIVLNLLSNAVKFTEKGYITVELRILEQTENKTSLQIKIKDTGIGIASEDITKLFLRFSQANLSVGGQYGGSGLGLFITKRLINLMGGDIQVKSTQGKGSTFQFEIVAENAMPEVEKRKFPDSLEEKIFITLQQRKLKILIVDDNIINQKVLKSMLDRAEQLTYIANDGAEAIALFSNPDNHFDIIFMDIMMPKMSGLTATEKIRCLEKEKNLPKIPIVALSGNAQQQDKESAFNAGMDDYLTKPFKSEQIYEKIMMLCHPAFFSTINNQGLTIPTKLARIN